MRFSSTTPKRRIVYSAPSLRRTKRGILCSSTLECGHGDWTTATERKRGWSYCFDCFYGKPVSEMGKVILAEIREGKTNG